MKWFAGVLFFLIVAFYFQLSLLIYAMYVMLGLLILSRLLARNWTDQVRATRRFPDQAAEVDDVLQVKVTIRNEGQIPVPWVIAEDLLPKTALQARPKLLEVEGKRIKVFYLRGRGHNRLTYTLIPKQRGFFQVGPVMLEGGDLFGLFRRFRLATEPHFLLVYPKMVPLLRYDLASRRPIGEIKLTHRLFEDPTRISGVREYQNGDPMNRVHWKVSARQQRLHSKVYEPSSMAGGILLLDFHRDSYPKRSEPFRSELAITTAASLINTLFTLGQPFGLITNARDAADRLRSEGWRVEKQHHEDEVYHSRAEAEAHLTRTVRDHRLEPIVVRPRRDEEHWQVMRETLARLELNDGLTLPELIEEAGSELSRQNTVIALLSDVKPATVLTLRHLKQSGYALYAVLIGLNPIDHHDAFGHLLAENIETRMVANEAGVSSLCNRELVE